MSVGRIALLVLALAAGAGAFFLLASPQAPAPVQIVSRPSEDVVRVLVAARQLRRGETLSDDATKWVEWPERHVGVGFITEADAPEAEERRRIVARGVIAQNEPIIEARIARKGSAGYLAALLTPGMRAISVEVRPDTAVSGFILPGDQVDILHTVGDDVKRTRVLIEDVRVLAVDQLQNEPAEGTTVSARTVTLELTPDDAEVFTSARSGGGISLSLRSLFKPEDGEEPSRRRRRQNVQIIRYGRS